MNISKSHHFGNVFEIIDTRSIDIIGDDNAFVEWANNSGFSARHIDDFEEELPQTAISICTSWDHFHKLGHIMRQSSDSLLLTIPQVSFDPSTNAAIYSFERLLESNFIKALELHEKWRGIIANATTPISFSDKGVAIDCTLAKDVAIASVEERTLKHGKFRSVAEYFEIAFEHNNNQQGPCFNINGKVRVDGLLSARAPDYNEKELGAYYNSSALIKKISNSNNATLTIENNIMRSVTIDGAEVSGELGRYCSGSQIKELAIGFNVNIKHAIDWSIHSQVNEGICGIHMSLGNGTTGLHMDLVCSGKSLVIHE